MDNTFALNGLDFSPEINMARYLQFLRTVRQCNTAAVCSTRRSVV